MSGGTDDQADYESGYGKPPAHAKFAKGVSGNPAGRPKGSLNLKTLHRRVYGEEIDVTVNGQKQKMSRLHAIIRVEADDAMKGDPRAREAVCKRQQQYDAQGVSELNEDECSEEDLKILERFGASSTRKH